MHVGGITLFIFGGVSRLTDEPPTPAIEFKMAIAGPVTSLVLAGLFWVAWRYGGVPLLGSLGYEVVGYLALINLVLGIFNLIPGFPLDGGRVLRSIIWGAIGNLDRATRAASVVGQGFGYLFIFGGFWMMLAGRNLLSGLWLVFIGWFLNNAAQQSYQQLQLRNVLSGVRVGQVMTTDYPHIDPDLSIYDFVHDYLLRYDYSAFPVSSDGTLVGIVTVQEVRDIPRDKWHEVTVGSVAQPPEGEATIEEDDDAFDALSHMAQGNSQRLIVMCDGKLKGMVTQESIISLVRTKMRLGI
jgi:CBS domain-containing protein